jgi:hypothetical protein
MLNATCPHGSVDLSVSNWLPSARPSAVTSVTISANALTCGLYLQFAFAYPQNGQPYMRSG